MLRAVNLSVGFVNELRLTNGVHNFRIGYSTEQFGLVFNCIHVQRTYHEHYSHSEQYD